MADDWFNEDPFNNILRDFFGESRVPRRNHKVYEREFVEGEEEDRVIDFIETKDKIFLVFEIPGYSEKDVSAIIKERKIEIYAQKKDLENLPDYLTHKLRTGLRIKKTLPQFINPKTFKSTCRNGILEVSFDKK